MQGSSPAKTRASSRPSRAHGHHLQSSTNCYKLSETLYRFAEASCQSLHRKLNDPGSPVHACNVSWAHRTISLDSDAATHRAAAGTRHGGRARRPSAPTTPAGRGAAEYAVVPSTPPPAVDTPEGSASAQTLAAWYRAGRCEDRPRAALPAVLEVRDAASHPSMAH